MLLCDLSYFRYLSVFNIVEPSQNKFYIWTKPDSESTIPEDVKHAGGGIMLCRVLICL